MFSDDENNNKCSYKYLFKTLERFYKQVMISRSASLQGFMDIHCTVKLDLSEQVKLVECYEWKKSSFCCHKVLN